MKGLRICHLNVRSLPCHLKKVNVLTKLWTVFMSLQWAKHGWSPPGITVSSPWKTIVKFIAVTDGMTKKGWRSHYVFQRLYPLSLIQLVGLPYWVLCLQIIRQQLTMWPKVSIYCYLSPTKLKSWILYWNTWRNKWTFLPANLLKWWSLESLMWIC